MNRTVKRFIFPLVLFIVIAVYWVWVPDGYTDTIGAISTLVVLIIFPLFVVTLIWAAVGAWNDHKLRKQGIEVGNVLFPVIGEAMAAIRADREEVRALPEDLKKSRRTFRLWGTVNILIAIGFICIEWVFIGTLFLIGGCTLFLVSSPKAYSENVDGINMLVCPPEFTLDRIYEDFREYRTVYGSVCRGTTFPDQPALFWKSGADDALVYAYKPKGRDLLYVGAGADVGCRFLSEPLIPAEPAAAQDFGGALCWNLEYRNFVQDLTEVMRHYLESGEMMSMPEYRKGNVFFFEESFKLTGQRFTLFNAAKEPVMQVEGTYPLKTLRIYDPEGEEIFRVTKELVHALPHYLFYERGSVVGEFSKKIDVMRDAFSMQMKEGLLEMREVNILAGDNYIVTLNGERIGMIAERLNLTLENLVFDNMVLTVYDEKRLPLITALGVMAAREMARDREA